MEEIFLSGPLWALPSSPLPLWTLLWVRLSLGPSGPSYYCLGVLWAFYYYLCPFPGVGPSLGPPPSPLPLWALFWAPLSLGPPGPSYYCPMGLVLLFMLFLGVGPSLGPPLFIPTSMGFIMGPSISGPLWGPLLLSWGCYFLFSSFYTVNCNCY